MKRLFFLISCLFIFSLSGQDNFNSLVEQYQKNKTPELLKQILGKGMENHGKLKSGKDSTADLRKKLRAMIRERRDKALLKNGLVVHEWGSMLKVQGDKKAVIYGVHEDQSDLPSFVQVWSPRPLEVIRVIKKPILYFYSNKKIVLSCTVGCKQGFVTQWWPSTPYYTPTAKILQNMKTINGTVTWRNIIVNPNSNKKPLSVKNHPWWGIARDTDSTMLEVSGVAEKFLFYRAATAFNPACRGNLIDKNTLSLKNHSKATIKNVLVVNVKNGKAMYKFIPSLKSGETKSIKIDKLNIDVNKKNIVCTSFYKSCPDTFVIKCSAYSVFLSYISLSDICYIGMWQHFSLEFFKRPPHYKNVP